MFADEFRQPCSTDHLAEVMLKLCLHREVAGVFHWAGQDLVSRYELAVRIRERFGLAAANAPLEMQTRVGMPEVARLRPQTLRLDLARLSERLALLARPLADQLAPLRVPECHASWYQGTGRMR